MSTIQKFFASPPLTFRPWPFLVFNEEHEGILGEVRITEMLEGFKRVGFGGAYLHPRPGLITEYLSPRWFDLIRHSVQECKRLGLTPCLYDENSYPSGFAGGNTLAQAPDTRSRYVLPQTGKDPQNVPHQYLALYRWDGISPGSLVESSDLASGESWIAFVLRDFENMPFHAESSYVSLLDPRTAEIFLRTTHERYRKELNNEDWAALGSIFTDEPHLPGSTHGPWGEGLHCTPYILASFERRFRYDLRPRLAALFFDLPDSSAVRHDYYDHLHHLWMENWARPLERWCRKNRISLTGHYLEHDWPAPYATPGQMHLIAHQDWPGTDFLECFALLGHDFGDPQNFDPAPPGREPQALYFLKQALSVANQFRKKRVVNESFGAGGHDSLPADWARIGRYLVVHGVNQFVPHHALMTLRGTRKQDHPQFFSDQSPWFDFLKPLNDELGRLSWLASLGQPANRILLLDALTTGYCRARKADAISHTSKQTITDPLSPNDSLISFAPLRKAVTDFTQELSDRLFDFDIGDEYIIEESGSTSTGRFQIGGQGYEVILWPPGMSNLRSATVTKLESFFSQGGTLLGIRPPAITIDGRHSKTLARWSKQYPKAIRWFSNKDSLLSTLGKLVPPRLQFQNAPPTGLAQLYRKLRGEDELFIIVNSHPTESLEAQPILAQNHACLSVLDPFTGKAFELPRKVPLRIPPTEARILWCGKLLFPGAEKYKKVKSMTRSQAYTPEFVRAERVSSNVLVLDLCQLQINGRKYAKESVYRANERYWTAHGFDTNGWSGRVQMGRSILERDKFFSNESGGQACFQFKMDRNVDISKISLAAECPEFWSIFVNGKKISFKKASRWRDPRIRRTLVGRHLRPGVNEIVLEGRPFQVRQELDVLYLLGDFSVSAAREGFEINGPPCQLGMGSWLAQGMPFYDGAVDYHFRLPEDVPAGVLEVAAEAWLGSVVELRQGTHRQISFGPALRLPYDPAKGRNFVLRVIGVPKNLWGPWHMPDRPRKRAWSVFWRHNKYTIDTPRAGKDYDLLDLGLLGPVILRT